MVRPWVALAAAAASIVGCGNSGEDRVLGITATGTVQGFVYFDANGNRELDGTDSPIAGVKVALVVPGIIDTIADAVSDANGKPNTAMITKARTR